MRLLGFGLIPFFAASFTLAAEEEVDLRGVPPEKGQIISFTNKSVYKNVIRKESMGDRTTEIRPQMTKVREKEIEILGVENGSIKKVRIKVLKDVTEESLVRGKRLLKSTRPNPLDGQIIYGESGPRGWRNSLEDAQASEEQKQILDEMAPFKADDELLPRGKIKVGHQWTIGTEHVKPILGKQFPMLSAKGTGKLLRIEKEGDEPIAVLELDFEINGKSKTDARTFDMTLSTRSTVHRSLRTGYDLKNVGSGKLAYQGSELVDGEKVDFTFRADFNDEEITRVKPSR